MEEIYEVENLRNVTALIVTDIKDENYEPEYYLVPSMVEALAGKGFNVQSHLGTTCEDGKVKVKLRLLEPHAKSEAETLILKFIEPAAQKY